MNHSRRRTMPLGIATLLSTLLPGVGLAQTAATTAKAPAFDVVSIRENKSANVRPDFGVTANGYHGRSIPPFLLMITAFVPASGNAGLYNPDQIEAMPDWMRNSHYDIEAKVADEDAAAWKQPEVQRAMLQQMLADRFKLATHRELQEKPVFDLVVVKGGPKFKASATTDVDEIRKSYPTATVLPGGMMQVHGPNPHQTTILNATMADLGTLFGKGLGRPIVDKTGLTGRYDISLDLDLSPGPDGTRPDPVGVVLTASQEQLGLKLEPAKEKVEVLVIDHVEQPSEN